MGEHRQNSHHSQDNEHLLHSWVSLSCFIMFLPIPHFIPRKSLTYFSVAGGYFAFICAVSCCRQLNFWFTFIYLSPLFYDPPILCYMPTFHYFAESIFCTICHNWSIHSSIDGHLDYVQVLQQMQLLWIFMCKCTYIFISLGSCLGMEWPSMWYRCVFIVWRNSVFQSGWSILHFLH